MDRRSVSSRAEAGADERRRTPAVVEIVGPAGSGKTTLLRAITKRTQRITCGVRAPRVAYLSYFLIHVARFGPTFLATRARTRWFTRAESRSMVYLAAWYRALTRTRAGNVTVFDHGPIFRLATLLEFGPELTRSRAFRRWWEQVLDRWSGALDLIVWLDATDDRLLERIRGRAQQHAIQGASASEARTFLHRYRDAYDRVLGRIRGRGVDILRFDTGRDSLDAMATELLEVLDLE